QNLLGKRVDYSARSVIVNGPQLKLHQCGLPKGMALELFKPFVMKRLVELSHAQNVKAAKRMVERARPEVWDVLEEVITEHPVLLNRAPTLHRLGIQAFEPQLVEGKAIHLHPLVCAAFNADFDGDQMAVHVPLSAEAQAEARILMLSSNNILKPSDGRPVTMPAQDMVIGLYHLTTPREDVPGAGRAFSSVAEAIMAFDRGELHLNAPVKIRFTDLVPPTDWEAPEGWTEGDPIVLETTLGTVYFNETLPEDFPYVVGQVAKKRLGSIVNQLAERYPKVQVSASLDALKAYGFSWSTRSGVSFALSDVVTPPGKAEIIAKYEEKAAQVQENRDLGLVSEAERNVELIDIWTEATNEVDQAMRKNFDSTNTIFRMVHSGARGNWMQIRQIAGMRGLVNNPKGEIIPRPIISNYKEGLSVLEYFSASHGSRKGLADTALKTAQSGYLTRRLVDVSQDVIVREADCGTTKGLTLQIAVEEAGGLVAHELVETTVYGRILAAAAIGENGEEAAPAGAEVGDVLIEQLIAAGVREVKIRSVLSCDSAVGTCAACYGRSLATGQLVDIGEAVGIIAAQSIGEPGTQLTMRTFHTGGVASADGDITHGLPRVQELFEARTPAGFAPITESAGRAEIEENDKQRKITITPDDGTDPVTYTVSRRVGLLISDGDHVDVGQQLTQGSVDPKQVLRILGPRQVQKHLVDEVQKVYVSQGVDIHAKHIEVIVRQMLRRVTIIESGDTDLLPGDFAERVTFERENRRVLAEGGQPASGRPELMGITKASLATDSWLSAASFQETTRVLTEAALNRKSDSLLGLKENVIIGKLIPAGTGLSRFNRVVVEPTDEAKAQMYQVPGYDELDFSGFGPTGSVNLDDIDYADPFRTDFR
ncbi:MAG TPA: DNA-directed RNA polymerase subunit beta', partial [Candidatus Brachybacterium merdigallinarum]|nr:DNA-directed RNA polymerase subunit beta' [Candidatus Brachybacterium merdigallinarum]